MKKLILLIALLYVNTCVNALSTKWTWQTNSATGFSGAITRGVCVDNAGYTYAAGEFYDQVNFSGTVFSSSAYDAWVSKFDANGAMVWQFTDGGTQNDMAEAIALDPAQPYIYVTGRFYGMATFNGTGGTPVTLTSAGADDIFLAKYSSATGNIIWAVQAGGASQDQG